MLKRYVVGSGRKDAKNAGFTEKLIWKLSKGDLSHTQIMNAFNLTRSQTTTEMCRIIKPKLSYEVQAGEWFFNDDGIKDRIYSLVNITTSRRFSGGRGKAIVIKPHSYKNAEEKKKNKFTKLAKKRAALIRAGKYNEEAELMLCAM